MLFGLVMSEEKKAEYAMLPAEWMPDTSKWARTGRVIARNNDNNSVTMKMNIGAVYTCDASVVKDC